MSESAKTLTFLAIAAGAVVLSFVAKPESAIYDVNEQIGKLLSAAFEPSQAKRLSIVEFDEESATIREFEVAESDGVWSIPSKGGYPADGDRQMAEATTGVTDRKILGIQSDNAADHAEYGVIDPRSPKLDVGQTGVGVRVTLADENKDPLADLIIGKEVKGSPNQRYVRRHTQDVVYIVEIDPERFSTSFEDWIEDDLLNISPWDILRVQIKDYSSELAIRNFRPEISWDRRGEFTLRYDDKESKWVAEDLRLFDPDRGEDGEHVPFELADDEELDQDKLRDLKNALDDLRIVDVETKPAALSSNLKAGEDFLQDRDAVSSLVRRGFAPVPLPPDGVQILSTEGEVVCTMKDGVEYVLRFGNLELDEEQPAEQDDPESGDEGDRGVKRYLFVLVRFNESVVEKPELEALPDQAGDEPGQDDADTPEGEEEPADGQEPADQDASDQDGASDDERAAIEQRNQQKLDEYNDQLEAGRERVDELNARFGDWFYMVSDSVYSKIRLGRDDLIAVKESEEGESPDEPAEAPPASGLPGLSDLGIKADAGDADDPDAAPDPEEEATDSDAPQPEE